MSLLKKWGLGVEFKFSARDAERGMTRARKTVTSLRTGLTQLRGAASQLGSAFGTLAISMTPIAIGYGALLGKSSALAQDLEAQRLTMRVLLGDAGKADDLIAKLREKAASTPFAEGDLIEGSKRLLRITKDNVGANQELLDTALTMTALNPTKSVEDSVEAILDAASGGGFERLKEFGLAFRAEDFKALGRPGGEAWSQGVTEAIGEEMTRLTRGEDLVGALSQTFSGRLSTLTDNVRQILTGIGEALNEAIGPALPVLTDLVQRVKGPVIEGFRQFMGIVVSFWERFGQPLFERFVGFLDELGAKGIGLGTIFAFVFGAVASVFVGVVGALAGVGVVVGAVVSAISAVAGVISVPVLKVAGVLLAGLVGLAFQLGLVFAAVFASVRKEGEGPFQTVLRVAGELFTWLWGKAVQAWGFLSGFFEGFREGFGEVWPVLERATAPLRRVFERFRDIFGYLETEGTPSIEFFKNLGWAVGVVAAWAFNLLGHGIEWAANMIEVMTQIVNPFVLALAPIGWALQDLIAGTGTWGDLWEAMWKSVLNVTLAVINALVVAIVGFMENVVRQAEALVAAIPGGQALLDTTGRPSDALAEFRGEVSRKIENAIAETDLAAARREREAARETNVNVETGPSLFEGLFDVKTCIDGETVGRANGKVAVRNGERGIGPPIPAEQRGRVLRHGLEIQPLKPAEVL